LADEILTCLDLFGDYDLVLIKGFHYWKGQLDDSSGSYPRFRHLAETLIPKLHARGIKAATSRFTERRHLKRQADREKPVGEWNQFEGIADGGTVIQKVNGAVVNPATGCDVVIGKILITSEGQETPFRNLRLMPRQ
jgi:hypothetical protein